MNNNNLIIKYQQYKNKIYFISKFDHSQFYQIFRHGERTPRRTELPPNFTNYAMYEPWGLAQLTNVI